MSAFDGTLLVCFRCFLPSVYTAMCVSKASFPMPILQCLSPDSTRSTASTCILPDLKPPSNLLFNLILAWPVVMSAVLAAGRVNEQSISAFKHARRYRVSCPLQDRQSSFTADCVRWLRLRYKQHHASDVPVLLVGHSMGGLVARAAAVALAQEGAGECICHHQRVAWVLFADQTICCCSHNALQWFLCD